MLPTATLDRKQPLIPALYFCKEPRISNWVRQSLLSYVGVCNADDITAAPPFAVTESITQTGVPYYLLLGWFDNKYVSVMVDEGLRNIFEVPVIADRSFFRGGGTVVFGDLIWEYPVVGGGGGVSGSNHTQKRVLPRQCFLVNRLFKVAGVDMPANNNHTEEAKWTAEYTLLRNLFDPLDKDVLHKPRSWNEEARKLALHHRKIVCAGTCFGLIFKPRKWFPYGEQETMERTYLPTLRYEIDQPQKWVTRPGFLSPVMGLVHLQLHACLDADLEWDWRIYYRGKAWEKIDATLAGPYHLIFLPNELILRWVQATTTHAKSVIILVKLVATRPTILECETLAIRSEKALPDSVEFIGANCDYCAKPHTNVA